MRNSFFTVVFLFFTVTVFGQKTVYAPTLLSPLDSAKNLYAQVTLSWKPVAKDYIYKVQIDTILPKTNNNFHTVKNAIQYVAKKLIFGKKYYWRVKALSINTDSVVVDSSAWSNTFVFGVINKVYLTAPLNNSHTQDLPIYIQWSGITGTIDYNWQIDITPYFNSLNMIPGTTASTSANLLNNINNGVTYYWRVNANNGVSQTGWSNTWNFTTTYGLNEAVQLYTPKNDSLNTPPSLYLHWIEMQNAFTYEIQVTDSVFKSIKGKRFIDTINIVPVQCKFNNLDYGKTYYWRVRGAGASTVSAWSEVRSFTVAHNPTPIKPLNGATQMPLNIYVRWASLASHRFYCCIDTSKSFNSKYFQKNTTNSLTDSITFTGLHHNTWYYWKVRAFYHDTSAWSPVDSFKTFNGFVSPPVLLTPQNNSVNQTVQAPTFTWAAVAGASSYKVQIDTSSAFGVASQEYNTLSSNCKTTKKLYYNKLYYWRVKAFKTADSSAWSSPFVFSTIDTLPDNHKPKPNLYLPANGAVNQMTYVLLEWQKVNGGRSDAITYNVKIDTNNSFSKPTITKVTTNQTNLSYLSFGTKYYWRIILLDNKTIIDSSDVYSFTVINNPSLLSPLDNAVNQSVNMSVMWNNITGITNYECEIDTNAKFQSSSSKFQFNYTTDTVFTYKNLNFNTTYFWRVRALINTKTLHDTSAWSDVRSFSTINIPILVSPANNATNQPVKMMVIWNKISGADYECELNTSKKLGVGNRVNYVTDTVYTYKNLIFDSTYYWRVRAIANKDTSAWSEVRSFSIIKNPTLISPDSAATVLAVPNIIVKWNKINGAIYECLVYKNIAKSPLIYDIIRDSATVDTLNTLIFGNTYFWKVRAIANNDTSGWSKIRSLSTTGTLSISNPINNSTNLAPQIQLVFTPLAGATEYDYRIDIDTSFNTTYFIADSTYGITNYQVTNLLYGKKYYAEVRGRNISDTSKWSIPVKFSTIDTMNVLSPKNKSIHQMPDITLKWDNIVGIQQYNYVVDINKNFTSQSIIRGNSVNDIVFPDTLNFGVTYYWKVQAEDYSGVKSPFTTTRSFTIIDTIATLPPTITYLSNSRNITFNWHGVTGIKEYELQYDTVPSFVSHVSLYPPVNDSSYTVKSLILNKIYYWRIRAMKRNLYPLLVKDTTKWITRIIYGVDNVFGDNLSLNVYPIPSKDKLFMTYSNPLHVDYINLSIINVLGQNLYSERVSLNSNSITKKIDISKLQSGIYYLRISYEKYQAVKKIVIQ